MIEQAFYEHLTNDAGIAALVSDRIFPETIPANQEPPAITYGFDFSYRSHTMGGQGQYRRDLLVVNCWSLRMSEAIAIANAVEAALVDYRGQLGSSSPAVEADHIRVERRGPYLFEADTELYRVPLQFLIGYEE